MLEIARKISALYDDMLNKDKALANALAVAQARSTEYKTKVEQLAAREDDIALRELAVSKVENLLDVQESTKNQIARFHDDVIKFEEEKKRTADHFAKVKSENEATLAEAMAVLERNKKESAALEKEKAEYKENILAEIKRKFA